MAEKFTIDAVAKFSNENKAWDAVRILAECVEHVQPNGLVFKDAGTPPNRGRFELSAKNKTWKRSTVRELAVIKEKFDLQAPVLSWTYYADGLMWGIYGWMFHRDYQQVELTAYNGTSLMGTEGALRTVVQRARERGLEMTVKEVQVFATESAASRPQAEIVVNTSPMKKWRMFRAWVGPHLAAYVVSTVSSLSATVLLVRLGIGS